MEADGVHWGYWGFAAIKAILIAKFILIGRALHIGEGLRQAAHLADAVQGHRLHHLRRHPQRDRGRGDRHGGARQDFSQSIADLGGGTVKEMIATEFIVFLVFVPLFAFGALSEAMEDKALVRAFFVERLKFETVR